VSEQAVKTDVWTRRFHIAHPGLPRLICFPAAGGSASFYYPLSQAMRGTAEILAVQYPGRQDRRAEKNVDSIPELADRVFNALRDLLDRPPALFGHSMGAVVAFEVARRMERDARLRPAILIVSGRRAPSCTRTENVHRRDDEGVIAEIRRLNGTDTSLLDDDDVVRMILPALRGDYRAVETYAYQPGPKLICPVTVFVSDGDPQVTMDEARAWQEHTTGEFSLQSFHGGHFYLTAQPAAVAARIAEALESRQ
jgi:pyochelin biosynthesis protein PchC